MENRIANFSEDQIKAIKYLYEKRLVTPLLMLVYNTIDVLGYISGKGFEGFIDKYMTEKLGDITSSDLYGARCGTIHTNTPSSQRSKKNKAKKIVYTWGNANIKRLYQIIDKQPEPSQYAAVKIEDLCNSLFLGINNFKKDMANVKKLYRVCSGRMREFYIMTDSSGKEFRR